MNIKIPDNFFPPPGVPFETKAQRDLASALHNLGALNVQYEYENGKWGSYSKVTGEDSPKSYRIATSEPRKFSCLWFFKKQKGESLAYEMVVGLSRVFDGLNKWSNDNGIKNFVVNLKAEAEEVQP